MTAILGGLGAAVAWAVATLCSSRSSRLIGPWSVLAWVMLVGLVLVGPAAVLAGDPGVDPTAVAWLTLAAAGNVAGLLLAYTALRTGQVGVVAPIVSTEGAIAAVIAVLAGEPLAAATAALLALIATGVLLAGSPREAAPVTRPTVMLALGAALSFGASLYATGRIGRELPVAWAILPARVLGVAAIAAPLAVWGRLRLTRAAVPFVVAGGIAEVAGFTVFTLGARDDVAVAAVLASLFGAVAALLARVLFAERLAPSQLVGVGVITAGVASLSAVQA